MADPLSDCGPLIRAASAGKLRLVRLLVEGGAEVDGRGPRGETALLAACEALRGEPVGPHTGRLLAYLLRNKADPNAQDRAGRTALMYACMERAGAQVASALLAAGADPSAEDHSGASALVYAINAQHQPTLKVLMDACRARGRDIIIIATEVGANGGPVTRRYLNAPPSPDPSPASCMSPSDVLLKTGPPNSPGGENVFNFRGTNLRGRDGRRPPHEPGPPSRRGALPARQRVSSEPWLAIHNLACLNRAYKEAVRERRPRGGGAEVAEDEDEGHQKVPRRGWVQRRARQRGGGDSSRSPAPGGGAATPPACRNNALPSVTMVPPQLHLPPLAGQSNCLLRVPAKVSPVAELPHPPHPPPLASVRPGLLPRLPLAAPPPRVTAEPRRAERTSL